MPHHSARLLLAISLVTVSATQAPGQQVWNRPADRCDIRPGHSLVNGAVLHLKIGVESRFEEDRQSRFQSAREVLYEAITERGQQDNPGAWYYLGRYYQLVGDGYGADSAFAFVLEHKPECAEDVSTYKALLHSDLITSAYRTLGDGQLDSAKTLFRAAIAVNPQYARSALELGDIFLREQKLDSASHYVRIGTEAAADDAELAARVKRAMESLVRGYSEVAYQEEALIRFPQRRQVRDSLLRAIGQDSVRMARMTERVEQVWARGRTLDEQSRQVFEAESTASYERMDAARARLGTLASQLPVDSLLAVEAAGPAIEVALEFVARYPEEVEASINLARLLSAVGYTDRLASLAAAVAATEEISAAGLARLGRTLYNEQQYEAAVPVLESALSRNGYMQNALLVLAQIYYRMRDAPNTIATARRLVEVDPLNTTSVRMMAAGWNLEGNSDSVAVYMGLVNGGIQWHVRVSQFQPSEFRTVLNASVQNVSGQALAATNLKFDFLDGSGGVLYSETVEVPALEPNTRHQIGIRLEDTGAVAWKYSRQ